MKSTIVCLLITVTLVFSTFGALACAESTHKYDDMPIIVEASWFRGADDFYCLQLDITNIGDKTIRDVQGVYVFTEYDCNDCVLSRWGWFGGYSLYLYDADGNSLHGIPNKKIKPGETVSLVIEKVEHRILEPCKRESYVYVTWIDLVSADNWGTKNMIRPERYMSVMVPRVEVDAFYFDYD